MSDVPVFAVIGHPNEGKSSVVATLTEDDLVPISPVPGETRQCATHAIELDGEILVRIVDTPGFQMPGPTLRWMQQYSGPAEHLVEAFIQAHQNDPRFTDDCELLRPVTKGAGIIYVVDASRPLRNNDKAEMEILRLTGRPRMAVINPKANETAYVAAWKAAFAMTFNVNLQFNAHRATFLERIELLEALQHIEQEWGAPLRRVVAALQEDWNGRLEACADDILNLLEKALTLSLSTTSQGEDPKDREGKRDALIASFQEKIAQLEKDYRKKLKGRFLHNVFNADLAAQTVATQDLFSGEVWRVLGLSRTQLAAAFGTLGAVTGVAIDTAAAGMTFGVFTLGVGTAGAVAGWAGTRPLSRLKVDIGPFSRDLGGCQITVGPLRNPQLMFVLLDRALIYLECVSNWAHARREEASSSLAEGKKGVTSGWKRERRRVFEKYQAHLQKENLPRANELRSALQRILVQAIQEESG
jgi:GTP-binding protein EngB required for normal cell division